MTHIWVPNKEVHCPLCLEPFRKTKFRAPSGHILKVYFCREDDVFTFEFDASFNKWFDTDKQIDCPACAAKLRWFSRYTDGFLKAFCPECGIGFKKDSDVKINKDGSVDLEEFKQPEPTESRIEIPLDRLNIPDDKKRAYMNKRRRQQEEGNDDGK